MIFIKLTLHETQLSPLSYQVVWYWSYSQTCPCSHLY